jgi:hypothetical protein
MRNDSLCIATTVDRRKAFGLVLARKVAEAAARPFVSDSQKKTAVLASKRVAPDAQSGIIN